MKKALALVLAVVMMAGLAISASAAAVVTSSAISNSTISVNGEDPAQQTYDVAHGDIVKFQLVVVNGQSQGLVYGTDYTAKMSVSDGKEYLSDYDFDEDIGLLTFVPVNTIASSKHVVFEFTFTAKGANTLYGDKVQKVKFNISPEDGIASTYDLDNFNGNWPIDVTAGTEANEYGYISSSIFNAMKADSDREIIATKANSYELTFDKNSGSANGKIDINGSTTVADAVKNKNASVASNLMLAINLDSNSAVAKFVFTNATQDFLDAADSNTLYVYDANGKLTSYTAKINDDDNVEFTAPIGSYIVSPAKLNAVSGTGSTGSQKPIPGTGR